MRKRTLNCLFYNIMWYLIYLLPIFAFLFMLIRTGSIMPLSDCMSTFGLGVLTNNFVYNALNGLFGSSGVVPLFANPDVLLYLSYFICVYLAHLAVDVLLFIPRYSHKLMDAFGGKHE